MGKKEYINQEKINEIWREQWSSFREIETEKFFLQRLFVEGYPIIKKYIISEAREILEAGGGTGRYSLKIAQDFPQSNVIVSDILDESLILGKKLAAMLNINNVHFQRDDILTTSFSDNQFDLVLSDAVIQHLPEYQKAIREIKRITKPGGRILISTVNYWNFHTLHKKILKLCGKRYEYGYEKSFSARELVKAMGQEGINIVATDGFHVGYGIFRLKKYYKAFHYWGRVVNRLAKILDRFTGRFFTRNFGFEILVVGEKPLENLEFNKGLI